MSTNPFSMQNFTIGQSRAGMKVSTDSCLFGAYIPIDKPRSILDIGAGTGLLSLMLAQRESKAHITAIEVESGAVLDCKENISESPFSERIQVLQSSIQDFQTKQRFDLIISNPPFFESTQNSGSPRSIARQQHSLTFQDLAKAIMRLLSSSGYSWILIPSSSELSLKNELNSVGLKITSKIYVSPTRNHKPNRLFIQAAIDTCSTSTQPQSKNIFISMP